MTKNDDSSEKQPKNRENLPETETGKHYLAEQLMDTFEIEMDRTLRQIIAETEHMLRSELRSFSILYIPGRGWSCTIHEEDPEKVYYGLHSRIPRAAVSLAMIDIFKTNEAEEPYDKPVFTFEDHDRIKALRTEGENE